MRRVPTAQEAAAAPSIRTTFTASLANKARAILCAKASAPDDPSSRQRLPPSPVVVATDTSSPFVTAASYDNPPHRTVSTPATRRRRLGGGMSMMVQAKVRFHNEGRGMSHLSAVRPAEVLIEKVVAEENLPVKPHNHHNQLRTGSRPATAPSVPPTGSMVPQLSGPIGGMRRTLSSVQRPSTPTIHAASALPMCLSRPGSAMSVMSSASQLVDALDPFHSSVTRPSRPPSAGFQSVLPPCTQLARSCGLDFPAAAARGIQSQNIRALAMPGSTASLT